MRILALIALGALATAARAQTPADSSPPARGDSAAAQPTVLQPVTVIGERLTTSSALETPLVVTTVRPRELFGMSGHGINDALTLVPGVIAQSRSGGSDVRLVVRGFGARGAGDRSNAGTARGVRVLVDGFPSTEPDGRTAFDDIDLATAEAVDVIRSNASSVWGNAAGGVVSISTVPATRAPFATVQPIVGSFGLRRYVARAGAPLGAGQGFGSVAVSELAGWRAHSASERLLVNLGAIAPVGSRTRLSTFATATRNRFEIPGPLTRAEAEADPRRANATYEARRERRDNRIGRLGAVLEHAVGDSTEIIARLFVNPKTLVRSERGTYRDFNRRHAGGTLLVRRDGALPRLGGTLIAGADYANQDGSSLFYSLTPDGNRGPVLQTNKAEGATNAGAFVQHELTRGPVRFTAGVRWDAIEYDYRDYITPALDARKTFDQLTPKLALNYRFGQGGSVYASYGGGVEAPAGNELDPPGTTGEDTLTAINPLLDPIRSATYELGAKQIVALDGGPLLRELRYDVALYHTAVRNEIVPYRGGRFYFTAGRARRRGAELALTARAAGGLTLQTALTASSNRYVEYVVDSVHYGRPGAAADYSGNSVVGVPSGLYSAALLYEPPWWAGVRAQLSVQGTSRYYADDANRIVVPGYGVASLTLGFDPVGGEGARIPVRAFVTVTNLFDRRYIASAFLNPDVVNGVPVAFEPGLPRGLLVSVSVGRFQR